MRVALLRSLPSLILLVSLGIQAEEPTERSFNIGFFEGGDYPAHSELRQQYRDLLKVLLPEGYRAVYAPAGFKSARWNRDTSRAMASELARDRSIDIVLALGPWTVEDLLQAGFDRPIIAAMRVDPEIEGLVDSLGQPIVDNLTLRLRPNKLQTDLRLLARLKKIDKLGLLYFPSGTESDAALEKARSVGRTLGFDVVAAEGYDNKGTYAFFKAYQELGRGVDAVYVTPLWGFEAQKIRPFYNGLLRDRIPVFSAEGEYHVARGALAAGSRESVRVTARYLAWKTIRIMQGMVPADLPTVFAEHVGLTINEYAARQLGIDLNRTLRLSTNVVEAPPPDDVERLTLVEAVLRAREQNPDYRSQYDVLESAAQAAGQAWSAYLPNLRLLGSASYFDDNTVYNDDRFKNDQYRASIVLDQEILSMGAIRDIKLAADNRKLAEVDLSEAALDLELGVTVAFINYLEAEQVRQVQLVYRRQIDEILQIAKARDDVGDGDPADILRWEDELHQATRAVIDAQRNLEIARILFNTLLGRPGEMQFVLEGQTFSNRKLEAETDMLRRIAGTDDGLTRLDYALITEAAAASPSLQRIGISLARQQTRLDRNKARFVPRIGFRASLNLVDERASTPTFEEKNTTWSVATLFELPLFLGGDRFRERGRLKAQVSELEYRKDDISLKVSSRIQAQVRRMLALAADFPLAVRSVELADRYVGPVMDQYNAGNRSIAELLDAARNDRRANLEAVGIQFDYFQTIAKLIREMGLAPHENGRTANEELFQRLTPLVGK